MCFICLRVNPRILRQDPELHIEHEQLVKGIANRSQEITRASLMNTVIAVCETSLGQKACLGGKR